MAEANEDEDPSWGDASSISVPSTMGQAPYTPRRLSMEEVAAMTASPPGPPQEEQGVPQQQAMVRRSDRNAAAYGVERGRDGRGLSAPRRQLSRSPYRLPSNDQGNDTVYLVSRQPAQPGGNRDTYRSGAASSQGQVTAPGYEMLIGAGQQEETANEVHVANVA